MGSKVGSNCWLSPACLNCRLANTTGRCVEMPSNFTLAPHCKLSHCVPFSMRSPSCTGQAQLRCRAAPLSARSRLPMLMSTGRHLKAAQPTALRPAQAARTLCSVAQSPPASNQSPRETGGDRGGAGLRAVVVGAGPAGCVTAMLLAQRGFSVDVLERRPQPAGPHQELGRTYLMILSGRLRPCNWPLGTHDTATTAHWPLQANCSRPWPPLSLKRLAALRVLSLSLAAPYHPGVPALLGTAAHGRRRRWLRRSP